MEGSKVSYIPCFLCGDRLVIKRTKRDKPYFLCDPCGAQVFIRRKKGIRLLRMLVKYLGDSPVTYPKGKGRAFTVLGLVNRLAQLKAKRQEIEDKQGWFDTDEGLELATNALETEIQRTQDQLKTIVERG